MEVTSSIECSIVVQRKARIGHAADLFAKAFRATEQSCRVIWVSELRGQTGERLQRDGLS